MREKLFSEMRGIDGPLREAVLEALDGHEPDNFIQSSLGGAVDGPPDSQAEAEERKLIEEIAAQLQEEIGAMDESNDDD